MLLPELSSFERGMAELEGVTPGPVATVRSGPSGRFRLIAPEAGMWRVRIEAPGKVALEYPLWPLLGPVELPAAELADDRPLEVRVHDAAGRPIAGASVRMEPPPGRWVGWRAGERSGTTGADGRLTLGRAPGEEPSVVAYAPGYLEASEGQVAAGAVKLLLKRAAACSVQLVGPGRRPLEGALLRVGRGGWPAGLTGPGGKIEAGSTSQGHLAFEVATRDGELRAQALRCKPGGAVVRVELPEPRRVSGRVIDLTTQDPVSGAFVWRRGRPAPAVRTSPGGGYELSVWGTTPPELAAVAAGYVPAVLQPSGDPAATPRGPTFPLRPMTEALAGVVVDAEGRPLPGASVETRWWPRGPLSRRGAVANDVGGFVLAPLPAGDPVRLEVRSDGYLPLRRTLRLPQEDQSVMRLALSRGRAVRGLVRDAEGLPLTGVRVELRRGFSSPNAEGASGQGGRFELPPVAAGTYTLRLQAPGYAPASQAVEVPAGQGAFDLGTFELEPGVTVSGTVFDSEGNPVLGAEIFLDRDPRSRRADATGRPAEPVEATSAADGSFHLRSMQEGEVVDLEVWASGFVPAVRTGVEAETGTHLDIVLQPASRLSGRVVDRDRRPVPRAWVSLTRAGGSPFESLGIGGRGLNAGEDGRFLFTSVEPGIVRLVAVAEGYGVGEAPPLEVVSGEDREAVEVVLPPEATVFGRVLGPQGEPAVDARVGVLPRDGAAMSFESLMLEATTDGDGYYRLGGLAAGSETLEAAHPEMGGAIREVELSPGAQQVDFELQGAGGHSVSGVATTSDGAPAAGVGLTIVPLGGGLARSATTGPDGSFELTAVPDGEYRVAVEGGELFPLPPSGRIVVAGSPVVGHSLVLTPGTTLTGHLLELTADELAGVEIGAFSTRGSRRGRVDPGTASYRIAGLMPGQWQVEAQADGGRASGSLTVGEGQVEAALDLQFEPGLTLRGQVVRNGEPVPGTRVVVEGLDRATGGSVMADSRGLFRLAGLEVGSYRVDVYEKRSPRPYGGVLVHRSEHRLSGDEEILLQLDTGAVVGSVRDRSSGEPVAGARLDLLPLPAAGIRSGPVLSTRSAADGGFRLKPVPAGSWQVVATHRGYEQAREGVELAADSTPAIELEIGLEPATGLVLEVLLPSGRPAQEVEVHLLDAGGAAVSTRRLRTGEGGRARVPSAPRGLWNLFVRTPSGGLVAALPEVPVPVPGPPVRVQLRHGGRLELTVPELADDSRFARLRLRDATGRPLIPGSDRRFRFGHVSVAGLPPGSWRVTVETEEGQGWEGLAEILPAKETRLRLE